MDTRTHSLMNTLSSSLLSATALGCLLIAVSQPAVGVIILGPAPGASAAAQTAQYNRQWAIVERSRNDRGEFRLSPNIILVSGFNTWSGVNTWGGVNGWTGSGSTAAYGAAYNRQRAIVNQVFMGNHWSSRNHGAPASAYRNRGH